MYDASVISMLGIFHDQKLGLFLFKNASNAEVRSHTVDGRNPKQPPGMVIKPLVNNGIYYLSPGFLAGFQPSTVLLKKQYIVALFASPVSNCHEP